MINSFWNVFENLCTNIGKRPNPVGKEIGVASSTIAKWKSGTTPNGDTLVQIADYFDVSVDYLLGRTENPQVNSSNNITTGDIQGNHNANINIGSTQKNDDIQEIIEMLQELSLIQRSEIVLAINKMKSEK